MFKRLGLLPRLILGIALGIAIGLSGMIVPVRILATFSGLFGEFLGFVIPLIIIGFVAPGISDLGSGAGKLLGITAGIAYGSTVLFGSLQYFVASTLLPKIIVPGAISEIGAGAEAVAPYFESPMPPMFEVTTALLLSFILGVGIAVTNADVLKRGVDEFSRIITSLINSIIIPLLPVHIAGIFATMAYTGEVFSILSVFAKVFLIIIVMHWVTIFIQFIIANGVGGGNPVTSIRKMIPAYFTAIGTQSSAATIPVTLRSAYSIGIDKGIADFVIPLCATIHLAGSTITLLTCAMAVMLINGQTATYMDMLPFIMMLGVTMVAAPGVPGGAVMASLGLLESMLGFNGTMTGLMIALYTAQDSFGTACNITGDAAIAVLVNKISGNKLNPDQVIDIEA